MLIFVYWLLGEKTRTPYKLCHNGLLETYVNVCVDSFHWSGVVYDIYSTETAIGLHSLIFSYFYLSENVSDVGALIIVYVSIWLVLNEIVVSLTFVVVSMMTGGDSGLLSVLKSVGFYKCLIDFGQLFPLVIPFLLANFYVDYRDMIRIDGTQTCVLWIRLVLSDDVARSQSFV